MESSRSWECIVLLFSVVVEFSRVAPSDSFYSLSLSLPLYLSPSLSLSLTRSLYVQHSASNIGTTTAPSFRERNATRIGGGCFEEVRATRKLAVVRPLVNASLSWTLLKWTRCLFVPVSVSQHTHYRPQ